MRKSLGGRNVIDDSQIREVLSGLRDCYGLEVAESDLSKQAQVKHIFSILLVRLMGVSLEGLRVLVQVNLDAKTENSDFYFEMVYHCALRKRIAQMCFDVGLNEEFAMRDILRPEPIRITRILLHFVDFYERYKHIPIILKKCDVEVFALEKNSDTLESEKIQLNNDLEALQRNLKIDGLKATKKLEELEKLKLELLNRKKSLTTNQSDLDKFRTLQNELIKNISLKGKDLKAGEEIKNRLRRHIIPDAKKAREEMEILRNRLLNSNTALNICQEKSASLSTNVDELSRAILDVEDPVRIFNESSTTKTEKQEDNRKLQKRKEEVSLIEAQHRNLTERTMEIKKHNENYKKKFLLLEENYNTTKNQLATGHIRLKSYYADATKEELESRKIIADYRSSVEKLSIEIKEHDEYSSRCIEILLREASESRAWCERYIDSITAGLSSNPIFRQS